VEQPIKDTFDDREKEEFTDAFSTQNTLYQNFS